MADFSASLPWILKHEGGWSNDPADPGGATNFGITLATAQRHGIMTKDALKAITPGQVAAIYRKDYWKFDGLDDQAIATKIFDMAVNLGMHAAVHIVQDSLNEMDAGLNADGRWGPLTEACVNACRPDKLMDLLCEELKDYYNAIVAHRPESQKFLKGWLNRAEDRP